MLICIICRTWHPLQLFKTRRTNFLSTWLCAFFQNSSGSTGANRNKQSKQISPPHKVLSFYPASSFTDEAFAIQRVKRIYPRSQGRTVPELGPREKLQDSQYRPVYLINADFLCRFTAPAGPGIWKPRKAGKLITCLFMEVRAGSRESHRAWPSSND